MTLKKKMFLNNYDLCSKIRLMSECYTGDLLGRKIVRGRRRIDFRQKRPRERFQHLSEDGFKGPFRPCERMFRR